ncbi:MAG TPA: ABC transporter substrate-binding protein [Candidatus Nitrosopolaris sp.]|nr:ABC transporter substrate-binding protein [Candidatus Nitrosopolaris sp.]
MKEKITGFAWFLILTMTLFSSVSFSSCSFLVGDNKAFAQLPPIKLEVGVWATDFFAFIAQEKGYFNQNNVDVQLTLVPDYVQFINGYSKGQYDGIIGVYADIILQDNQGIDTKVVYAVDFSKSADAIIGKANNLTEVKGQKIGVGGINTFSHFFVLSALEKVGLTEGDVQFANIPAQNVSQALDKGEIFAGHTYLPYLSAGLKSGYHVMFTAGELPGLISTVLAFRSNIVEQRPQDVQAIISSFIEAEHYYDTHREDALNIMSSKSGVSKQDIIQNLNGINVLSLKYNSLFAMNSKANETTSLYGLGNRISEFFVEKGQMEQLNNISELIEPKFVNTLYGAQNVTMAKK